jgi:uncharacterized protein YuzE
MAVTYDPGADILEIKFREGRVEHALSGKGEFIIYVDERGAFWVVLIVYEWDKKPNVEELKRMGVEVLSGKPVSVDEAMRLVRDELRIEEE